MINMNVEKLGPFRVVECDGRIVRSDAAFALRDNVTSQADARVIVLDLSEVNALEGGGLGILIFLQRWAQDHHIQLKLFTPRTSESSGRRTLWASPLPLSRPDIALEQTNALIPHDTLFCSGQNAICGFKRSGSKTPVAALM